ncbi:MAG TPA: sigma-54 dependent transcriptional regulator [Blastocatellia bacterium]|nr:sigma-54 dependent transcriptional regulator [Blastocatellia bacterium]
MTDSKIMVIESARPVIASLISRQGFQVLHSSDCADALKLLSSLIPDVAIISVPPGKAKPALEFVRQVRALKMEVPIVLAVAESSEEMAIEALNAGVNRYLKPPLSDQQIITILAELLSGDREPIAKIEQSCALRWGERLIGNSPAVCDLRALINKLRKWTSNVLITGETGTGKELVAELIHANSPRSNKPFVCLNSAAIPDSLLESELFGHEKGAFTGAQYAYQGKLALANTGTIFFDEIGDISSSVQAKLLRALDGKEIYRLGSNKPLPLSVRILAATNQDLDAAVEQKRFRQDLYYRLNVIRMQLPSLKDRTEDIPKLLTYYVKAMNQSFSMHVEGFTGEAMNLLMSHSWPGNVRELKNVVEAIFVNLQGRIIDIVDLPEQVKKHISEITSANPNERELMIQALVATNWNKTRAADKLHWSRMTLYRKMNRYKILRSTDLP